MRRWRLRRIIRRGATRRVVVSAQPVVMPAAEEQTEPEEIAYFAEAPDLAGYGEVVPEIGYVADPPPGFTEGFAEPADVAYFAEPTEPGAMGYVYEAPEAVGFVGEPPNRNRRLRLALLRVEQVTRQPTSAVDIPINT
jgi:hypothetical protein